MHALMYGRGGKHSYSNLIKKRSWRIAEALPKPTYNVMETLRNSMMMKVAGNGNESQSARVPTATARDIVIIWKSKH